MSFLPKKMVRVKDIVSALLKINTFQKCTIDAFPSVITSGYDILSDLYSLKAFLCKR
jgi:hypothetical protein